MRRYVSRLVILNAMVCSIFGAVFAVPIGHLAIGLGIGLLFGVASGLFVEVIFRRWEGRWLYRRRLLFLVLLEVILLLYLLLPAYITYFSSHPPRMAVPAMPDDLNTVARDVSLQTPDDILLSGWYIPPQNGKVIIALHGLGDNRMGVLRHARLLIDHDYGVLMMDMRAHGKSGGDMFANGWNAPTDIGVMIEFLQSQPDVEHIGALGLSAGAISILHAGAEHEALEIFIADGTGVAGIDDILNPLIPDPAIAWLLVPDYWMSFQFMSLYSGIAPAPSLRKRVTQISPRPILFIAGAESLWEPELAAQYASYARPRATVWVIANVEHIAGIHRTPDEYATHVITFLDEHWAEAND